jgi:hypothetical protein
MNRPASDIKRREGSAEPATGPFHSRSISRIFAVAIILFISAAGCMRDEPPIAHGGSQTGSVPPEVVLHMWDTQADLDRVVVRLEDSRYSLTDIVNPDPNQYGADGGRALRCDLVGVDLLFWTFDDEAKAREAGERWENEAGQPLRWTVAGNMLLVLFADDDFTGVSAEAAGELSKIFAAGDDGGTEDEE